ncbi:MAG: ATP-binding protein [Rhodothermales bacterium]
MKGMLLIIGSLWCLLVLPAHPAGAQTARVQFIHASPYAEAAVIDVYRNGELWLDDVAFTEATPFIDWPEGRRFRLDFTWADAPDNGTPFFSETLTLAPGQGYYVVAAGDPRRRTGQPAFQLYVQPGAVEASPFGPFPAPEAISVMPDGPRFGQYWRGSDPEHFFGRLTSVYLETNSYGEFTGYVGAPSVMFDADLRAEMGDSVQPPYPFNLADEVLRKHYGDDEGAVYASTILNFTDKGYQTFVIVDAGFLHPPGPGDAAFVEFMVLADGTTERNRPNTALLQWINNAPYAEAAAVDVYINGFLVVDDLGFRRATHFMELPAGLADFSAPTLTVDVTAADAVDTRTPLFSKDIKLLFGETYVGVVAGDPRAREGQQPMDIHLVGDVRLSATRSDSTEIVFFHGAPDVPAVNVGVEGESVPLSISLGYGSFESYVSVPAVDDTLFVEHAVTRNTIALFEADLAARQWADSAVVVLTSGFASVPGEMAGAQSDFALVAALPAGGPLLVLAKEGPPGWWQNPWVYVIGFFGLSFVALGGYQVRIRRLRARERALNTLVDERTKELVAEKKKTEEQARRLVELDEAKNRFFANISHEFRTPLTLILGPLQDALDGAYKDDPHRLEKQHQLMHRSARRLLRLINQLLDLSRLESGKMHLRAEPGDLVAFTRDLTRSFVPLAERRRLDLRFEAEPETLLLNFDADALEKVFSNLLSNALKFTPEGGKVLVTMDACERDDGSWGEVSVRDNGPGIAKEDLARIFDRFQQVDTSIRRKFEGSGIGLTLAKELVELHGGEIRAESEVGFGSVFTVRLPRPKVLPVPGDTVPSGDGKPEAALLEEALLPPVIEVQPAAASDGKKSTILVVEDNADVRAYLRSHLDADYHVVEAEDGEAGLERARETRPDLILADVMMPRMDGYEMCRLLKAHDELRAIPVVMLTAKAGEQDTLEGLGSGADDYLAKPFSVGELKARVANLIASRREMRAKYSREVVVRPADITITPEEEVFLDRVLEVANEHLGESTFSVDWLAEEVGLSRRQLERRVEAVTGQAPAELIRRLRLERASQLLRARAGTVSEIAYSVGFRSAAHFSKAFRMMYGESPSEHRHTAPAPGKV